VQAEGFLQRRISLFAVGALAIVLLVLLGQSLQSRVHLNHDVSWFVHFSGWLLQGRALGSDVYSASLPMVWAVFMPPALLAQFHLLREPQAVQLVFWLYFLLSVGLLTAVLSRLEPGERPASLGWVAAFVLITTLAPGFSFGQREHACVLFAMPYLAAAVLRLQGGSLGSKPLAIGIGVLAGIGFGLKPHLLAVPALVELLLLVVLGWRSLLGRVESLAMGFTVAGYVACSALLLGSYLKSTIGLTLSTYWAYDAANLAVVVQRYLDAVQPAVFGALIALVTRTWRWQHTVLLLAMLGYSASYFVQAKGFIYHAYPVQVCSVSLLGVSLGHGLVRAYHESRRWLRLALLPLVILLALPPIKLVHDGVLGWYATYNIAWGPAGQFRQAVIDTVNYFAPTRQSYYFAFTTHPFPGFPTASYAMAEYSGRSIDQPFIAAYARVDEVKDLRVRAEIVRAAEYQRRMVVEDFERRPPTVVFAENSRARLGMNGRQFDDIAFYLEDARFRRIWAEYEEYRPLGTLRVFVRRGLKSP
jgi:hypothetical protein